MEKRPCVAIASSVVMAALFLLGIVSTALGKDLSYLAPSGEPASAFPRAERPVAEIVSPNRSTEEKRDANNESGQLARLLGLKSGMTVGDIGAGSGYHTVRLAPLLGSSGVVIAQDVNRQYLAQLVKRTERLKLQNVKFALGEPHDPRLPRASLDAAILVHMYHEIAEPYAFLHANACDDDRSRTARNDFPVLRKAVDATLWKDENVVDFAILETFQCLT